RATLGSEARSAGPVPHTVPQRVESGFVGPMEVIASGSVTKMVDSSSAALLSELNSKRSRLRLWPLVAALSGVLLIALIAIKVTAWMVVPLSILLLVALILAYQFDQLKKSVVILYDLESDLAAGFERLHDQVLQIGRCAAAWQIDSRG